MKVEVERQLKWKMIYGCCWAKDVGGKGMNVRGRTHNVELRIDCIC